MSGVRRPVPELPNRLGRILRDAIEKVSALKRRATLPPRSHQELSETAMALLTLWATFKESDTESVARTTRSLMAHFTPEDLSYLVLHMAGLSRGLLHAMAEYELTDVDKALQWVAIGVQERRWAAGDRAEDERS